MSLYTVGEILIFIVAAAVIGGLIGWILRSLRIGMQMAGLESSWRSRYEEAAGRLHTIDIQLASEASRRAELEGVHEADTKLVDSLHAELADRFSEVTQLREALQRSGDDLTIMSGQLSERGRRITEIENEITAQTAELEEARRVVVDNSRELEAIRANHSELLAQSAQELEAIRVVSSGLQATLETVNADVVELDRRAAKARTEHAEQVEVLQRRILELEALEVDLRDQDSEASDLRFAVDDAGPTPASPRADGAERSPPPPAGRVGLATKLSPTEARERLTEIAVRTAGGVAAPDDDLVQIHGVGPKIAALLKSMGVSSFVQIARFEDDDIDVVAAALNTFKDRIRRDDWMSDARKLHRQKYGIEP